MYPTKNSDIFYGFTMSNDNDFKCDGLEMVIATREDSHEHRESPLE